MWFFQHRDVRMNIDRLWAKAAKTCQDAAGFGGLSQLQDGRHQKQTPRTRKLNPRCDPWEEPGKID